ncbi:MAG: YfiR family protein [Bacteroidales bacterium]|nr:YfiR family protein [Bacteroidales bacterium]
MKIRFFFSRISAFTTVFLLLLSIDANAQKEKIQTAFLYQITRLIEWCPEGTEGNFIIGVVGNEPAISSELNVLAARRVGSQQIEIKTFSSVAAITKANILFVPESQFNNINEIVAKTSDFCTLIVAEQYGATKKGAGISIVYNSRLSKLEFEISKSYMRRNSLNVSNQLYDLATSIY